MRTKENIVACGMLIFAVASALILFACATASQNEKKPGIPGDPTSVATTDVGGDELDAEDLRDFQEFAESYEPRSGREVIPSPPTLDARLSEIVAKAQRANCRDHEKFVVLVLLKLSRFQIENFKERYELGHESVLTDEFYRLIDHKYSREFNPAYLADDYVAQHQELLAYAPIQAEIRRIKAAGERIIKNQ